jgi:hypothetical protein
MWDTEKNAERYRTDTYPKVLELLKGLIVGTPRVATFTVATSTVS